MKFALAFAALAGAVAPPKISLSLEGMTSAYKLADSIIRDHDQGLVQNNGEKVMSRQDWTEKCAARRACATGKTCTSETSADWVYTSATNCPFPVAKGYDHQDKQVDVVTRVFLVDEEGTPKLEKLNSQSDVNWNKRSTYLFKYDAKDAAGNHAEQVVFALILNDDEAPFFQEDCQNGETFAPAITVEAVSSWRLCQLASFDNLENRDTGARIEYQIEFLDRNHDSFSNVYARCTGDAKTYVDWTIADHVRNAASDMTWTNYEAAAAYMNPKNAGVEFAGKYLMTARATDKAGVYGHNAKNNYRDIQQAILVRDQNKPVIYLAGSNPEVVECRKEKAGVNVAGVVYTPTADVCHDKLDTTALGWALPVTTTYRDTKLNKDVACPLTCPAKASAFVAKDNCPGLVKQMARRGTQTLKYNCHDFSNNQAPLVTRTIKTVDTIAPTLNLVSGGVHMTRHTDRVEYVSDATNCAGSFLDVGKWGTKASEIFAEDKCDATVTTDSVTMSWGPRAFNCRSLGDYVRTYTVSDADSNTVSRTRTFAVIDNTKPRITVVKGKDGYNNVNVDEVWPATRDSEYTDKGATCMDDIDGELSHAVEVSGEVVNKRIPGSYTIQYDCQDLSGNEALAKKRTVKIQDITAPVLTLLGAKINYVEAGFPYIDAGATATDELDGDVTQYIWTDGNTVDQSKAFYQSRSCQQIYNMKKDSNNGEYIITAEIAGEFKRIPVHCFFTASKGYTFHIHTTGAKGNCASLGLIRANDAKINTYIKSVFPAQARLVGNLDDYVCTVDPAVEELTQLTNAATAGPSSYISDAEQGKYIIKFNVEDKAGNAATKLHRTVVVKDTLPPVITLHLKNKLIHSPADFGKTGINHGMPNKQWNPANYKRNANALPDAKYEPAAGYKGFGNPNFMAETATTNGWLIGAVASAVTGVALLGFSARKSTVTSVPV